MIYYAVRVGRKPGIYTNWAECFICISGYKNAEFKKFKTEEEAIKYIQKPIVKPNKSQKLDYIEQIDYTEQINKENMYIYTDGSCINNGYKNAKAGIGIYFGENDQRNISDKFTDNPSNQRAELYAIIKAILLLKTQEINTKNIIIYTDSMYSINCIKKWSKNWIKNGWQTKNKKPVKNQDLIKLAYNLVHKNKIFLKHIKAHTYKNDEHSIGNSIADKLAFNGAS